MRQLPVVGNQKHQDNISADTDRIKNPQYRKLLENNCTIRCYKLRVDQIIPEEKFNAITENVF